MLASLFTAVLAATTAHAATTAVFQNETAAGSKVTWPSENATIPLNGTVYVQWEWKEATSPKLKTFLVNKNATVFHPGGNGANIVGLGGAGLFDLGESFLANKTNATWGPLHPAGDTSIRAGAGYHLVLGWPNTGEDKETVPYLFIQSAAFNVGPKGPDQLPEGVKNYTAAAADEKAAAAAKAGSRTRAGVPAAAAVALAAVGAACLF